MDRTYIKDVKSGHVLLKGFVHEIRDIGKLKFLLLRDMTGTIQITANKKDTKDEIFKKISKISRESSIAVEGKVKESKQAPGGKEIIPEKLEIINESETLPIDISERSKTDISKRLDMRSLDLHNLKVQAVFKIQSEIVSSFREFFKNKNFIEIQPPCIISSASEGGTELFPVMYFEKPAFLAQSPQLYKQMAVVSLEKVSLVVPVWRAEKHNTVRHINEARQMDIEMAFANDFDVMKELEGVVQHIVKNVIEKCKNELKMLDVKLYVPKAKYLSYDETINLLRKNKVSIRDGDDIPPEGEKKLCELFKDTVVFVHDWPSKLKPFYIMPKEKGLSKGFDALYGGIEISSGGQRVHLPELLIKQLKEKNLNPQNFEHYISSFRYGAPEHSGWSIGLERFTMALLGLNNIRECTLFPRDRDRLVP